jgi:hypothetical protein
MITVCVDNIRPNQSAESAKAKRTCEARPAKTGPIELDYPDRSRGHLAQEPITSAIRLSGSGDSQNPALVPAPSKTTRQVDRDLLGTARMQAGYYLDDFNTLPLTCWTASVGQRRRGAWCALGAPSQPH